MSSFIIDRDTLRDTLTEVLCEHLERLLPDLVEEATRRPYLTRKDVKALTGWSDRQLQHLRDTRRIPFVQIKRTILYPSKEFYEFLESRRIEPHALGGDDR